MATNKTWMVIVAIIATAAVVGGGIYYYLNNKAESEKSALKMQIYELEKRVQNAEVLSENYIAENSGVKKFRNSKIGVEFNYPRSWLLSVNTGLPEGTGITPVTIKFSEVDKLFSEYTFNDIQITIYPVFNNDIESYNYLYQSVIEDIVESETKEIDFEISGLPGKKYYDTGGIGCNPTEYVVKNGNEALLVITDYNSEGMIFKDIDQSDLDIILSSFNFINRE